MVPVLFVSFVEELKKSPAPEVAVKYYTGGDLYLFGKFVILQAVILSTEIAPRFWHFLQILL